jgi:glycolate oxidase FAD binding subunit
MASIGASVVAYPLTGTVRGYWAKAPSAADLASLRGVSRVGGGALVIEAAPAELKRQIDVWGEPGADIDLMRRLKQQFDPKGTLSPGRFVGGL